MHSAIGMLPVRAYLLPVVCASGTLKLCYMGAVKLRGAVLSAYLHLYVLPET